MSNTLTDLGDVIASKLPDAVTASGVSDFGDLVLNVKLDKITNVVEFLKTNSAMKFSTLVDITAIDYPSRENRFEVVYHFLSMYMNLRIRLNYRFLKVVWCLRFAKFILAKIGLSVKYLICMECFFLVILIYVEF